MSVVQGANFWICNECGFSRSHPIENKEIKPWEVYQHSDIYEPIRYVGKRMCVCGCSVACGIHHKFIYSHSTPQRAQKCVDSLNTQKERTNA